MSYCLGDLVVNMEAGANATKHVFVLGSHFTSSCHQMLTSYLTRGGPPGAKTEAWDHLKINFGRPINFLCPRAPQPSIMQTALMAQVTNEGNQLQFYDPGNSISLLLPTMRAPLHQATITCPLFRVTEAWKVIMWVASPLRRVKRQFLISSVAAAAPNTRPTEQPTV